MPFGGLLSLGMAGISAGTSLYGMLGGGDQSAFNVPKTYQYANMGGADTGAYGGIGSLSQYNVPAQLLPQYQSIAQNMVNNPYANFYQGGAGQASAYGIGAGQNAYSAGGQLSGAASGTLPDVQALLALGFDPQNALYAQTLQKVQDQTRAAEGVRGIAMTPYGAGLENDATRNFNIDWQNNQLARATQGAQGAGQLLGAAGSGMQTGAGLQAGAGQSVLQGASYPYSTFQGINADALSALSGAGQFGQSAAALPQTQIQDYLAYLSGGNAADNTALRGAQVGLQSQGQQFGQNQIYGQNFGSAMAGLGQGWGKTGWGNPFAGMFGSTSAGTSGGTGLAGYGGLY